MPWTLNRYRQVYCGCPQLLRIFSLTHNKDSEISCWKEEKKQVIMNPSQRIIVNVDSESCFITSSNTGFSRHLSTGWVSALPAGTRWWGRQSSGLDALVLLSTMVTMLQESNLWNQLWVQMGEPKCVGKAIKCYTWMICSILTLVLILVSAGITSRAPIDSQVLRCWVQDGIVCVWNLPRFSLPSSSWGWNRPSEGADHILPVPGALITCRSNVWTVASVLL